MRLRLAAVVAVVVLAGCAPGALTSTGRNPAFDPGAAMQGSDPGLSLLAINDRPYVGPVYRREDWPHWKDPDHNSCDAREDALIAASLDKPHVARGCQVTAGRWSLVYVPGETTDPGQVDVDHVVPLGNAARSGGGAWSTDQRTAYANDPAVLWVVDDGANQAKGDRGPDQWRPAVRDVWCTYARRWIGIKVRYQLTATTSERDALGAMLGEC